MPRTGIFYWQCYNLPYFFIGNKPADYFVISVQTFGLVVGLEIFPYSRLDVRLNRVTVLCEEFPVCTKVFFTKVSSDLYLLFASRESIIKSLLLE